jgi:hypothetical protein
VLENCVDLDNLLTEEVEVAIGSERGGNTTLDAENELVCGKSRNGSEQGGKGRRKNSNAPV